MDFKVLNRKSYTIAQFDSNIGLLKNSLNQETRFQEIHKMTRIGQNSFNLMRKRTMNAFDGMSNVLVSSRRLN